MSFAPGPFSSGETVTIAVELYRHTTRWKARAVGQGYDTGLAPGDRLRHHHRHLTGKSYGRFQQSTPGPVTESRLSR
ncbi:TerD family protein [Streptomyces sp. NPDC056672]|uniref:TerD family protein n=1 Tax=Streptomyces sp. NPDC056672 TaxID=3345906 RepID=UPI0036A311AF